MCCIDSFLRVSVRIERFTNETIPQRIERFTNETIPQRVWLTHFTLMFPFHTTPKNRRFSDVFRGREMGHWAEMGLTTFWSIFHHQRVILKPIWHLYPMLEIQIQITKVTYINPIQVNVFLLSLLKILENLWLSEVFRGYKKETLAWNRLIFYLFYH